MIAIPGYIDKETWEAFCEMRKSMGKTRPFTDFARKLIIYELDKIRRAGHDPNEALRQSIIHGWSGVHCPRSDAVARPDRNVEATKQLFQSWERTPEEREASERARIEAMRRRTH